MKVSAAESVVMEALWKRHPQAAEEIAGEVLARGAYVDAESQGLLDRLFEGRLAPLVSHFSQSRKLTAEDIADLKRLIAELDP